jgi:amino acid adenylation domain-containing protein
VKETWQKASKRLVLLFFNYINCYIKLYLTVRNASSTKERIIKMANTVLRDMEVLGKEHVKISPMSFAQEGLWILDQLGLDSAINTISATVHVSKSLTTSVLEESLSMLVQRHEALRTAFSMVEEQLVQVIAPSQVIPLTVFDLREQSGTELEDQIQYLAAEQVQQAFVLSQEPLLRCTLLHLADEQSLLLLTAHRIICDEWALGILVRDLAYLYEACCSSESPSLPSLPWQYADFAVWQRQTLTKEVLDKHLAYWRQQLADAPDMLQLPTDHPRQAGVSSRGSMYQVVLPNMLTQTLQELSQQHAVSLDTTLVTAFQTLLYRYTGQEDLLIGVAIPARKLAETEAMVGICENTLVLRTDLSEQLSFADLLGRVHEAMVAAQVYEELPFESLIKELYPTHSLSRNPLFQVQLQLPKPRPTLLSGWRLEQIVEGMRTSQFDLTLALQEGPQGLTCRFTYSTDLFDEATIARLAGHWQTLLESIVANPNQSLSILPLLTEQERQQLLVEWNATQRAYPLDQCLHQLFEAQVERTPQAVAVICEGEQLNYQELNAHANRLAHQLREHGVGPDKLVALLAERGIPFLISILAVFKAGGAYLPLDPHHPPARLRQVIELSECNIVLSTAAFQPTLALTLEEVPAELRPELLSYEEMLQASHCEDNLSVSSTPHDLAYVIYTSGSTGKPKGAMVEQRGMVNHIYAKIDALTLTSHDKVAQTASQCFDISVWQFLAALLVGGSVEIYPNEVAHDPVQLLIQVEQHQITILETVPSLMRAMLDADSVQGIARLGLKALRWLIPTGEALPVDLCRRWLYTYPHVPLINAYGPTECSDDVTHYPIYEAPDETRSSIPVGRVIPNMRLYVLDRHLEPLPIGVSGELYVGGIGVGRGYLGDKRRTDEAFVPDPFGSEEGARLYKTGDLVRYLPDGNLEFLGRLDFQVKVRGFRIELGEIEAVLGQHPAVRLAIVMAREDLPGNKRLVAYVEQQQGQSITAVDLKSHLTKHVPTYMVPSAFVLLEKLPLTPNGKIDRKALPVPESSRDEVNDSYVAARSPLEQQLVEIWEELLGVHSIGIEDDFFELGGDSLLAMRVTSRLHALWHVNLSLHRFFEVPTVAQLVETVSRLQTKHSQSCQSVLRKRPQEVSHLSVPQSVSASEQVVHACPVSLTQKGLWFLQQMEPESVKYNMYVGLRVCKRVDIETLKRSLNALVQRHEALRTIFGMQEDKVMQLILPTLTLDLPVYDLQHLPEGEREAEMLSQVRREARCPFDLTRGPLLRAILLHLGPEESLLFLTMHHIITDGWSLNVFLPELTSLYEAFASGQSFLLPDLPLQYSDFVVWQREQIEGGQFAEQLAYWERQLAGAPEVLDLPVARPMPAQLSSQGATYRLALSQRLAESLRSLSRQQGVTLYMTMMAAFQILLYRYTGQEDMVIGTFAANRQAETEALVGFFVSTLVMRTDLSGDPSFADLLGRVREVVLAAQAHQDIPFASLVKALRPDRQAGRNPLFQVVIGFDTPLANLAEGWESVDLGNLTENVQFELALEVRESSQGVSCRFEYRTELFDEATIARLVGHWQTLLEAIVADPTQSIARLPLLTEQERHQLLVEWHPPLVEYFQDRCVHELFEEQVERTPEAVAVVCEGEQLTYGELNSRANQLACHLREKGIHEEVAVGLCIEPSVKVIVGLLAILKAGGVYVPMDPTYPPERIDFMAQETKMAVLITEQHLLTRLGQSSLQCVCLDADWPIISQCSTTNLPQTVKGDHLAYIIFTSGSTGQPKGVLIEQQSIASHCGAMIEAWQLSADDCCLQLNAFTFDASLEQILPPLLVGARLVLRGPEIWSPAEFLQQAKAHQITVVTGPCGYWHEVISHWATLPPEHLSGLRLRRMGAGGDRLSLEAVQLWRQLPLPSLQLFNLYGPTEGTITSTFFDLPRHIEPEQLETSIPIGRPLPNRCVYLLDKLGQPVPQGVAGELHIGGRMLARGYLNHPELTKERFIADPFSQQPGARLYKTGDLARYLPTGLIEFVGRVDHQVKIRGFRVEPGEIEAVIALHPAVYQTLVMVREDTPGVKRLVAYVVPHPDQETSPLTTQLYSLLKERLPSYMIPAAIVLLETFPLNASGKVDRHALPAPNFTSSERQGDFVAPCTPLEENVARIWAKVLGLEQISIHDDFFALGGDSLLGMQVLSRLQALLNVTVPLSCFFEAPTVAQLAEVISHLQASHSQSDNRGLHKLMKEDDDLLTTRNTSASQQVIRAYPASLTQEGLWFLQQLEPESVKYNMYVTLRVRKALDIESLERSLNTLVQRHEALRTIFGVQEDKVVQQVLATLTLNLQVHDLQHLPEDERKAEAQRLVSREARRPFDLALGPLLRASLFQLGPEESSLFLNMHHIITDGWSLNVLLPELTSLYEAFASGQSLLLPDLPLQYSDFAVWQREQMEGGQFAEQLAYWQRQLAKAPEVLDLPVARAMPAQFSSQGATYHLALPQRLTESLKAVSRRQGVTLYMTMLAAFQTLLHRYTGQEDMVVGTFAANRQAETEALVGFFVNTLVVRTNLSGDPSFVDLLGRVREVVLAAQANQEIPFASLVKALRPDRQAGRNPLFQILVTFDTPILNLAEGWEPVDLENLTESAQFELALEVRESPQGVSCHFEYSTDLFDEATIARLVGHWQTLLAAIVANPNQPLSTLLLLTEQERQQLLVEWNATQTAYSLDQCLHQLFEAQVERTPQAVAVVFEGEEMTYQELNRRANQLAHYLQHLGVGPEVLVGICVERSLDMVVGLLGILKAGGAYVPLDPNFPSDRIAFMLEDAQAPVLVTQQHLIAQLSEYETKVVCLDTDKSVLAQQSEANLLPSATSANLAYVIYTSGSTGRPKGVQIIHRAVVNFLLSMCEQPGLSAEDTLLAVTTLSFDIAGLELFLPLIVGARVIVAARNVVTNGEALIKTLAQTGTTVMQATPVTWRILLAAGWQGSSHLKVLCGGEALPMELAQQLLPKVASLWNLYGPTETTIWSSVCKIEPSEEVISIGRPIANTQIYLLDAHLQPVPIGVPGELYIGGDGLARGYLNRPELTAERFIYHPSTGERLYKTGDLARYRSDGTIEHLGRLDFQVKLRGFRIELGEIEAVLGQYPAVRLAIVMAREDTPGDKRLVAYIELQQEQSTTAAELKSHLTKHLPAYMVPSAFVLLEKLPLTPNGKVDRKALPAPDLSRNVVDDSYVAPRSPVEQQLVEIWEDFLGTRPIGIKDDFFGLGGNSFLAVRLFDRMAQVCGKKLPLSTLFAGATIEHVAKALVGESGTVLPGEIRIDGRAPLVVVQKGGSRPPFFYLHGDWKNTGLYSRELARYLGPEQPFYLLDPYKFDDLACLLTYEEMAAAHLETMCSIQPEGPYFLGGYCNGALLAYEMARQLQAKGQTVGLLLLIDSDSPEDSSSLVRRVISGFGKLLGMDQEKQFECFLSLQHVYRYLRFAHYRSSTNAGLQGNSEQSESEGKESKAASSSFRFKALLPRLETLRSDWLNTYDWLAANYKPSLYPGKITFFWSKEEPERAHDWRNVIKAKEGEVDIYINPGDHISARTEYLPILAQRLRECLMKAQAATES